MTARLLESFRWTRVADRSRRTRQHFDQTMAALDAGCHVLVEKTDGDARGSCRQLIARGAERNESSAWRPGTVSPEFAYIAG